MLLPDAWLGVGMAGLCSAPTPSPNYPGDGQDGSAALGGTVKATEESCWPAGRSSKCTQTGPAGSQRGLYWLMRIYLLGLPQAAVETCSPSPGPWKAEGTGGQN